jgi:hypothetical protein
MALLLSGAPVLAQDLFGSDEEEASGLLVWLEAFGASPGNGGWEYATRNIPPVPAGGGDLISLDFGSEVSPRIGLGWKFGESGAIGIRYWTVDSTAQGRVDAGFSNPDVGEILLPPLNRGFDNTGDAATAEGKVETTTIDVEYIGSMGRSGRASGFWRAGIRMFDHKQELRVVYSWENAPQDRATILQDQDGMGPIVGVGGKVQLHERVYIAGELSTAFVMGKSNYNGHWELFDTQPLEVSWRLNDRDKDRTALQFEGGLGFGFTLWSGLDLILGYRFINLDDVVRRAQFVDDLFVNTVAFSTEDLTYDGPFFGLTWTGGRGR